MRLKLDEFGLVYPNDFIPIIEELKLIDRFSLIMLNKLCIAINKFIEFGYKFDRISINFSTIEINNPEFLDNFKTIITNNNSIFDKIGVEFTESKNETDFI